MIGKEASNELRERVRDQLLRAVSQQIQKRCQKFVDDGQDVGTGVRDRILDLFDGLIAVVIEAARQPAIRVLNDNYEAVYQEIRDRLQKNPDPLRKAEEAVLAGHEEAERRSKAQKRRRVLDSIAAASKAMPGVDL